MKYTSGCIATRRTMSSVARDTSISNFLLGNLRDFRSSAISSSISSGVSKRFFVTSLDGRPLVVYENRPARAGLVVHNKVADAVPSQEKNVSDTEKAKGKTD